MRQVLNGKSIKLSPLWKGPAAGVKRQIYKIISILEGAGRFNEKDLCIPLKSKVEKIRFQQ